MPRNIFRHTFVFYLAAAFFLFVFIFQEYAVLYIGGGVAVMMGMNILFRRTLAYSIEDGALTISLKGGKWRVHLKSIKSIRQCPGDRVLRYQLLGISMPGLALGLYKGHYGRVTSYVKSSENVLLIELDSGKKITISNIDEIARKIESMGIAITRESHVAG